MKDFSFDHHELSASPEDKAALRKFYCELYAPEFPDADERESLTNMEKYLELKSEGWYGKNNYHILVMEQEGRFVAGSIIDYLASPNSGVIEFFVVAPAWRDRGIGTRLLQWTEQVLTTDARENLGRDLDCIIAEMNDPFKEIDTEDNLDPFVRAMLWHKWGYNMLDFPYVQPALSKNQKPVSHLLLVAKLLKPEYQAYVPAVVIKCILHEYMRLAMRIDNPALCSEYKEMGLFLNLYVSVAVVQLASYIGRDEKRAMIICEIKDADDRDIEAVLTVYQNAFTVGPTTIDSTIFRSLLSEKKHTHQEHEYHLWAIRPKQGSQVDGMVSCFTFPGSGFCGYIAFDEVMRGTGRLRQLMSRIEEQMLRDKKGARGWYIECNPDGLEVTIFRKVGFREAALAYRQPPLQSMPNFSTEEAPVLRLMYKEFGRTYSEPRVSCTDFLTALEWIYRIIYRIEEPRQSLFFKDVQSQTTMQPDGFLKWR